MSVIFLADGSLYSSKLYGAGSLTMPVVAKCPPVTRANATSTEGDGGWSVEYKKGTYRRKFNLLWTLLTNTQRNDLENFFKTMDGPANWFTVQITDAPDSHYSAIFTQGGSASTTVIVNTTAFDTPALTNGLKGAYIYVLGGLNQGFKRKIDTHTVGSQVVVSPAFDYTVNTSTSLRLGYPVIFDMDDLVFNLRYPSYYDVNVALIEKVSS